MIVVWFISIQPLEREDWFISMKLSCWLGKTAMVLQLYRADVARGADRCRVRAILEQGLRTEQTRSQPVVVRAVGTNLGVVHP